jgi:hypothetical protein
MGNFDPDYDAPVQEKHPDWLEWFSENDLDIHTIALDPAPEYDPEQGSLTFRFFHLEPGTLAKKIGWDGPISETLTVGVSTPPPWERRHG